METISISSQFNEVTVLQCRRRMAAQTKTSKGERASASTSKRQSNVCFIPTLECRTQLPPLNLHPTGSKFPVIHRKAHSSGNQSTKTCPTFSLHSQINQEIERKIFFHVATIDADSVKADPSAHGCILSKRKKSHVTHVRLSGSIIGSSPHSTRALHNKWYATYVLKKRFQFAL